ncbi:hypothetical protein VB10N_09190 [Vibrio sp. 10N]|nr:hypothetical protein VB10N_09190 [Vibrio sp. 10N]
MKWENDAQIQSINLYLNRVGVPCSVQSEISHGKAHYQFIVNKLSMTFQQAKALVLRVRKGYLKGWGTIERRLNTPIWGKVLLSKSHQINKRQRNFERTVLASLHGIF